jgi:hypothetical protein
VLRAQDVEIRFRTSTMISWLVAFGRTTDKDDVINQNVMMLMSTFHHHQGHTIDVVSHNIETHPTTSIQESR